jgi:DNA primase
VSRSNAAWSTGKDETLVDVRIRRMKCPVCGSRDRCGVRQGRRALVLCYKVPSAEHSADGGFIHRLDAVRAAALPVVALPPSVERAPPEVLDRAYRAMCSRLGLSSAHRAALLARGLSAEHIAAAGYATLEREGRAALARAMVDAVGEEHARRTPGYVTRERDGRSWPSVAGWPGLLVPCRDERGRILGLQVRRDEPGDGPRYVWLSSRSQGGASASTFAHVPVIAPNARRDEVIITEGPLKADVVTALDGRLCIAVPGVSAWARALPVVEALRPRSVLVAFDTDVMTNPAVKLAHDALCSALAAHSIRAASLRWPPLLGKGLDDALLSQRQNGQNP